MSPLPPTYRTFIQPETLPEKNSYPAPVGCSLIASSVYTKIVIFLQEDDVKGGGSVPVNKLEKAIAKALSTFYIYAGRLSSRPRGRFAVQDFEKGCLFQVCQSPDSMEEYKKNQYGYATIPIADFVPLQSYTSLDSPLLGIQLTQVQDGRIIGFSFYHRVADGWGNAFFIFAVASALADQALPIELYYDWQRPALKPSPKYDHSIDYPVLNGIPDRGLLDPNKFTKRVFIIPDEKAEEIKRQVEQELPDSDAKITVRDAITAFMYRAIVKARRIKGRCDLVCMVSKRLDHPDKRLMQHFGNYLAQVTVPDKHDELMSRPMASTALRIREQVAKVNPEFMDSLEYYLNNLKDPTKVCPPIYQMSPGCVLWSDWSRFSNGLDFGYGKTSSVSRSWVDPSPNAVVTLAPKAENVFDVVVQLDLESMERLINDKQVQSYTLGAF